MSDIRKYINLVTEAALTPAELSKHGGKYLEILIQFVSNGLPVPVDPGAREVYGDYVQINQNMLPALEAALKAPDIRSALPKVVTINFDEETKEIPWGAIFKGKEFTGIAGKKPYNAGHLAELIMGLCITAKFLNLGADITVDQLKAMIGYVNSGISGNNYRFSYNGVVHYPELGSKNDSLAFVAVVPVRSAEAFMEQANRGQFENDLAAVLSSAVRYCNESEGVQNACYRVRHDKGNNKIEVISDGTSDAKGTKADLQLKVDGSKINLLSLKTFSTETLGQISGIGYEQVSKWFDVAFGIDIGEYRGLLDPTLPKEKIYNNLLTVIYDQVVHPQVEQLINDQSPGKEAAIVQRLAYAAQFHARGEGMEDVEIVKLDDSIKEGNYKILRFSDDLVEAMRHFDLETRYVGKGQGRTIQIWVKPAEGEKVAKGSNKLCQFRTQKMGDSYRNYYEIGPMMEQLTRVERRAAGIETGPMKAADTSMGADRVQRPGALKFPEPSPSSGRQKR
jgi:hypothetical protein